MPSQPQATQNESHVFLPGSVSRNLASAAAIAKMVYEKKKRYSLCVPLRNIRMAIQPCRRAGASNSMVLSHIGCQPDYSSKVDRAKPFNLPRTYLTEQTSGGLQDGRGPSAITDDDPYATNNPRATNRRMRVFFTSLSFSRKTCTSRP